MGAGDWTITGLDSGDPYICFQLKPRVVAPSPGMILLWDVMKRYALMRIQAHKVPVVLIALTGNEGQKKSAQIITAAEHPEKGFKVWDSREMKIQNANTTLNAVNGF